MKKTDCKIYLNGHHDSDMPLQRVIDFNVGKLMICCGIAFIFSGR